MASVRMFREVFVRYGVLCHSCTALDLRPANRHEANSVRAPFRLPSPPNAIAVPTALVLPAPFASGIMFSHDGPLTKRFMIW